MLKRKNISKEELLAIVNELKDALTFSTLFKIKRQREKWFFFFHKDSIDFCLLFNPQKPFIRTHLIPTHQGELETEEETSLRVLISSQVKKIGLYHNDRIVECLLEKGKDTLFLYLNLIPGKSGITLKKNDTLFLGQPLPEEMGSEVLPSPHVSSHALNQAYQEAEEAFYFEEKKKALLQKLQKSLFKLKKEKEAFARLLEETEQIERLRKEADLFAAHFHELNPHLETFTTSDFEDFPITLKLEKGKPLNLQLKKRYQEIKKKEKRKELLPKLIEAVEKKAQEVVMEIREVEKSSSIKDLKVFERLKPVKKRKEIGEKSYRSYTTERGFLIYVGRSDKENEEISFRLACGNDLWFHVDGFPGAHVLLKGKQPDPESIQDALQLAKFFSKAKEEPSCAVVMTEAKFLHKQKSAPLGQVTLKQRKVVFVHRDEKRLKRLFSGKQPLL